MQKKDATPLMHSIKYPRRYPRLSVLYVWRKCLFVCLMCAGLAPATSIAADGGGSNQALEQLRMLQQRLSSSSDTKNQPSTQSQTSDGSNTVNEQRASTPPSSGKSTSKRSSKVPGGKPAQPIQPVAEEEKEVILNSAFEGVTDRLFPLTPEQIVTLKQMLHTTEFAGESPVGVPPKPTATSQFVNLSPGSTPPVIRLSQGFVSSLVFLDSTGAPWPISAYDLGNPSAFNITWDKSSNTIMIQAHKLYTYGNLAVRLKGLNTPVMLTLIPGQKAVDYRVDLRVQGYGPNAKMMPVNTGLPDGADEILLHILDGVPPPGSTRLSVSGGDARAWLYKGKMLIRTNLTILSPAWMAIMTSGDGMHAYEMQKSPVLLVSWHGKVMQLKIEGI